MVAKVCRAVCGPRFLTTPAAVTTARHQPVPARKRITTGKRLSEKCRRLPKMAYHEIVRHPMHPNPTPAVTAEPAPAFWRAPWEFAVHTTVGTIIFGIIAAPAIGLGM